MKRMKQAMCFWVLMGAFFFAVAKAGAAEVYILGEQGWVGGDEDYAACLDKSGKPLLKNVIFKHYHKNGTPQIEYPCVNGKVEGIAKMYYENGKLMSEVPHKAGKPDGIIKTYYKNGKLMFEGSQKNGLMEGAVKTYYENGTLASSGNMKNDIADGVVEVYRKNGKLAVTVTHQNGKPVSGTCYRTTGRTVTLSRAELDKWQEDEESDDDDDDDDTPKAKKSKKSKKAKERHRDGMDMGIEDIEDDLKEICP